MPSNAVALDSSVLIEHFRMKDKDHSLLNRLMLEFEELSVSPLVLYEIQIGRTESRLLDSSAILENLTVLPFGEDTVVKAAALYQKLKQANKLIDHFDILIAASAIVHDLPLATLNRKHFERIEGLILFDDERRMPTF